MCREGAGKKTQYSPDSEARGHLPRAVRRIQEPAFPASARLEGEKAGPGLQDAYTPLGKMRLLHRNNPGTPQLVSK